MSVSFAYPIYALVLLAIIAIAYSTYFYFFTIIPINKYKKITLITLRSIALILTMATIFDPNIVFEKEEIKNNKFGLLIDNSASMQIISKNENRLETTKNILNEIKNNFSDEEIIVSTLSKHSTLIDSVKYGNNSTNLSTPLENFKNENIKSILILSDGNYNEGSSPLGLAEKSEIPFFTIGVGDTLKSNDIILKNISGNSKTFVGNQLNLNLNFTAKGFDKEKIKLFLFEDDNKINEFETTLDEENNFQFQYTPKSEGQKIIKIFSKPLSNEESKKNNEANILIEVLKQKKEILIIGGAPSPDLAAISQATKSDTYSNVDIFFEKPDGELKIIEGTNSLESKLQKTEILIFVGYPTSESKESFQKIASNINTKSTSILFISGEKVDFSKLQEIKNQLPFEIENTNFAEQEIFINESKQNEIINSIDGKFWENLPPILTNNLNFKSKTEAEILAKAEVQNILMNTPVVLSLANEKNKSFAILGYGLWRWRLAKEINKKENFDLFFRNVINWLAVKNKNRLIVKPSKINFAENEQIEFTAEVFNESMQPTLEAEIEMDVFSKNEKTKLFFSTASEGNFKTSIPKLNMGNYTFSATAKQKNKIIGQSNGKLLVTQNTIEYLDIPQNEKLLKQISSLSGGAYGDKNSINQIIKQIKETIKGEKEKIKTKTKINFLNYYLLIIIIFCFATEWLVRKQSGLI